MKYRPLTSQVGLFAKREYNPTSPQPFRHQKVNTLDLLAVRIGEIAADVQILLGERSVQVLSRESLSAGMGEI